MTEVVILGAGELGGALAHILARSGTASAVRLVDDHGGVAAGKALDITQAAAIEGFATRVTGHQDFAAPVGADVVVVADRARGDWTVDEALLLLKRIRGSAGASVVIGAGALHRDLVDRGVRELGYSRLRLLGTAPEALASGARALVALAVDGSPADVGLTVAGIPPGQVVLAWDEVAIAGLAAGGRLDGPALRRLAARVPALWPPGPLTLAWAAAKSIAAVLGRSREVVCAFVAPDDAMGRRLKTAALPVRLGPDGIARFEPLALNGHDRVALENAMVL